MQITFNPHSPEDCRTLAVLFDARAARMAQRDAQAQPDAPDTPDAPDAPAQPDTPRADGLTATDTPDTPAQPEAPETAPDADDTDIHGMVHDDAIHSTPASKNADGSWRAKRGQKEAYDAAIAARTAPTHVMPTGMPAPQPAAEAPATPPAPIDYKTMADRFVAKMSDPEGLPSDYETIYAALEIGYSDLETNQTSIARLWHYMDAVDLDYGHDACVRHALGSV